MDLESFARDYIYLLFKLREQDRSLSERAIEYFWTNMLLRKQSFRDNFADVFEEFALFGKSGIKRAVLIEKALKEMISRYPRYRFIEYEGKYVWIFREGPELLQKACTYADSFVDRLAMVDIFNKSGSLYEALLSVSMESDLLEGDSAAPPQVIDSMVELLDVRHGMSIYDPATGFGRILYGIFKNNPREELEYAGLETDPYKHRIGKIALILLGLNAVNLKQGDPLIRPEDYSLLSNSQYDRVIIEPPSSERILSYRIKTGYLTRDNLEVSKVPGSQWSYIRRGIECLKPTGKMVSLIETRELGKPAQEIIDNDWLEAVIELPVGRGNLLRRETSILVINKSKPDQRKGKVLLVPESERRIDWFDIRNPIEWPSKITKQYREWLSEPNRSGIVSIQTIAANGYTLKPRDYAISAGLSGRKDVSYEELINAPMIELKEIGEFIVGRSHGWIDYDREDRMISKTPLHGDEISDSIYLLDRVATDAQGLIDLSRSTRHSGSLVEVEESSALRKSDIVICVEPGSCGVGIVGDIADDQVVLLPGDCIALRVREEYDPFEVLRILRSDYGKYSIHKAKIDIFFSGGRLTALEEIRIPDIVSKK
ncbi:HsdM family class I SAM-dependent methyltransferase [Mesotoga sp. UBA5557]|uniref:HsdM family class I SAM-dependent methyltransferase n=1 Tax=Mesotoga sp. UBA5557 TaxID=1946857 RepID=UPI000AB91170|nr:N-6 DNA methylase [Mesotoga sp. UBA5557]